jgi:Helix-turn-helix.
MISIDQCRAARALLDWSAQRLAQRAGVGVATVRRYEAGSAIAAASMNAMESALKEAGIAFISEGEASDHGGKGVRLTSV